MKKYKQTEAQNKGVKSDRRDVNPASLPNFSLSPLSSARFSAICKTIGWGMILFGIVSFVVAISLFTYQGPPLPPFADAVFELSFLFWPVPIILGVLLLWC